MTTILRSSLIYPWRRLASTDLPLTNLRLVYIQGGYFTRFTGVHFQLSSRIRQFFFGFSRCLCSFFIDYLIIYLVFDTVKIRKLNVCFMALQSLTSYLFKHLLTKTGLFTPLCLMFNSHILSLKVVSLFQSFMVITVVKNI